MNEIRNKIYKIDGSNLTFFTVKKNNERYRCPFITKSKDGNSRCNLLFDTKNKLEEHRQQVGHSKKRAKKKKINQNKKQLKIDQMVRVEESEDGEEVDEEGADDEEEDADMNCVICKFHL